MPYNKSVRVTGPAPAGNCREQADLRSTSSDESATGAKPAAHTRCPACGESDCHPHASLRGHARYKCPNCDKFFSVPPVKTRVQADEYERWLADMAS